MADTAWVNLLGNDIVIKRLSNGNGTPPEFGHDVIFNSDVSYRLEDGPYTLLAKFVNHRVRIGEGDCVPGLELSLRHSKPMDEYICKCSFKYGFSQHRKLISGSDDNDEGSKVVVEVPEGADLEFHVTVLQVIPTKPLSEMTCSELVSEAIFRKEVGNRFFYSLDTTHALRIYAKAVKSLSVSTVDKDDDLELYNRAIQAFVDLNNNVASCYLRLNEFQKAREATITALEVDSCNKKSLLKAGIACIGLNEYVEGRAVLKRLLELDPDSTQAISQLNRLEALNSVYVEKERQMYSKMSSGLFQLQNLANQQQEKQNQPQEEEEEKVSVVVPSEIQVKSTTVHTMDHIFPTDDEKKKDDDDDEVVDDISIGAAERRKKEDDTKLPLWKVLAQEFVISGLIALAGIVFLLSMRQVPWLNEK